MLMNLESVTEAYLAGKTASVAMLVVGKQFKGSMNVADALYERNTQEWESAKLGATLVIAGYKEIYTHIDTGLISKLTKDGALL